MAVAVLLLLFLTLFSNSKADQDFDVRQHLSTVTRYDIAVKDVDNSIQYTDIPIGCSPIHLNLVARHGTRLPTKKRMKEMEELASHIQELLKEAKEKNLCLQKVPAWLQKLESPWKGNLKGGELDSKGEQELCGLGIRVRERFPGIFDKEYQPYLYPIKTTQVPRTSASAVAFGMGLFKGKGCLGPGCHRAFAVTSESHASDIILRFFDCCQTYKKYKKNQKPVVDKQKEPILSNIASALAQRYEFNLTRQDVSSLWFLCKQQASLLNVTDQACSLFTPDEVVQLEWMDDLELFILKGYGNSLNYRMGVPLLKDVLQSMEKAIKDKEDNQAPGSYEKAKLRFAHAETLVPFSCLLGLFLEGSDFQRIQREEDLYPPPKPPQKRNWRGSRLAPFAGNNMLVLYSCPANSTSKYFVQVLHNEHPTPLPGCNGADFCPFEVFKEKIVDPHLKHDYDRLCNANLFHRLIQLFCCLCPVGNDDTLPHRVEL